MNAILNILFPRPNYKVSDLFPKHIFWDVNPDKLHIDKDKDLIINRVLSWGMDDSLFDKLEKLYSKKIIKNIAIHSSEIKGNETKERLTPCKPIRFCP